MPHVEVHQWIAAPPAKVYALAREMERYPEFMESVDEIRVLERGEDFTLTEWHARLQGRPLTWVERDEFDDALPAIRYRQVNGDLRRFEGEWRFAAVEAGGVDGTLVTLTVDFELGIPMLAGLVNPIAALVVRQNAESMLRAFQNQLEVE